MTFPCGDFRINVGLRRAREKCSGLFPVERRILAGHPQLKGLPRLILLLFGGIPNSPSALIEDAKSGSLRSKVTEVLG
jgi:hypothetical protein